MMLCVRNVGSHIWQTKMKIMYGWNVKDVKNGLTSSVQISEVNIIYQTLKISFSVTENKFVPFCTCLIIAFCVTGIEPKINFRPP